MALASPGNAGVRASPRRPPLPPDADASSETSSVHSGEAADRRDADILTRALSTKSEEYRLLFRLPPDEVLVQDFNCALQENILLQGHIYLFIHHICFYSNIFGFETKKIIHFREVVCVRKAKTAAIFPNAIEIVAGGKKHFFGSFISRDEAYRLIIDGWAQHSSEIKAYQENQDLKSEISIQENDIVVTKGSKELGDDPSSSVRTQDDIVLEETKTSPTSEDDFREVKENEREESTWHLIRGNTFTWIVEDVDASKVPEHFTTVAEAKFPILVEEFFTLFFSDDSVEFMEKFHKTCGDKDFQCTPWQKHEQFGQVRDVSFLHPIKVYLGAKSGHCQEIQKFRVYKNSHLMIETSQQVSGVPFGDCFHVEGIWDVEQDTDEETSCTLQVYSNVAFSKKTIFRGKIEQTTKEECQEVYAKWINLAHELLNENKQRLSKGKERTMCMAQPNVEELETSENLNASVEKLHPTCCSQDIPLNILDSRGHKPYISSRGLSTILSVFPQSWATMVSYVKAQGSSALILFMAVLALMILMQISIIILITRAPEVHLVSHKNDLSDIDWHSSRNIEWLEKHFHRLKEEMFMVETRMDRMRHEYALLKAHLQRLEQMKWKS